MHTRTNEYFLARLLGGSRNGRVISSTCDICVSRYDAGLVLGEGIRMVMGGLEIGRGLCGGELSGFIFIRWDKLCYQEGLGVSQWSQASHEGV